jgi:phage terminase large subunit
MEFSARVPFEPFHDREKRWTCILAHRRAGKTVATIADLLTCALATSKQNARYAYIAPYHAQAKAIAWDYLKRFSQKVASKVIESELRIELPNGSHIRLYGADNPDSLRGLYLDGVVLDEYGDMRPNVWGEIIRPLLADRKGWAVFIGTPRGKNHFWEIHRQAQSEDWLSLTLRASETELIDAAELEDAKSQMTAEQYAQEFECEFEVPALGAIYAREMAQCKSDKRVGNVPYDPALLVDTAWDLGIGDSTAIWFYQSVRGEVHVIDYYENNGQPITHYLSKLASKPYQYGKHNVPHDAEGRELGTGKSIADLMKATDYYPTIVPKLSVESGINAVRVMFPRFWFDENKCKDGLDCLMNYRRAFNSRLGEFKDEAVHDWASHGADAFRYLAVAHSETKKSEPLKYRNLGVV